MLPQTDLTWLLLQPSNLIFLLLLFGFLLLSLRLQVFGRRVVGLALLLAVLPALLPITELLAEPLETRFPANPLPAQVDGILVLGGSVLWPVTEAWSQLNTNGAGERMMAAAALARRYPDAQLVFTGLYGEVVENEFRGSGEGFFTGSAFENREVIYLGAARSTYEEALLSLEALKPAFDETWLLVTSAWHMPRAYGTFRTQGWTLVPYSVDYLGTGQVRFNPSLDIMGKLAELDTVAREWGALFIYKRLGRTTKLLP